jgi:hypothetical protein
MKDKMDERLDRLFAAARDERADISAADEFFETRLLARIKERREAAGPWYAAAWRLLPVFAVVAATITVYTFTFNPSESGDIFAAITSGQDEIAGISYLTGE